MATIKKLDPFGKGGATQFGGNQGAGSALIQTAVNGAAAGANAMLNRLNGTQGTSYVSAPKTQQVNVGTPYLYNAQSSFGDSGSMTATNAANAGSGNVSVSPYLNTQYTNVSPMDYNAPTMPVYAGEYDPRASADAYKQAINNAFSYDKPQDYNMYYGSQLDSIVNNVANRGQFSYDPNTDPVYQAYRKQYAREGQRATQDTMASAAGMTGGVPSSYAVSAAQQAGNYYASQMSDKLPELYNQAYNRYLQEYQNQLSALSAVNNAEQLRHNVWSGNNQNQWKGIGLDYDIHRDAVNDAYNAATLDRSLSNDEWARYVDMLNQYNTDRNFNYGQNIDQMNWERQNENTGYERDWNEENRDYTRSVYDDETAYNRQQDMYNRAVEMAKLGDYSLMEQLGLDTTYIRALNEAGLTDLNNQAAARLLRSSGSSGSSGGSRSSGSGGSDDTLIFGDRAPLESEEETSEEAPVTEGTSMEESINLRISSIADNAKANGGIVAMPVDWQYLLQYFDEDTLHGRGIFKNVADRNSYMSGVRAAEEAQAEADRNLVDSRGNRTYTSGANDGGSVAKTKSKSAKNNPNAVRAADTSVISHSGSSGSFVDTYEAARDAMKRDSVPDNVATGLLTESQWNKKKEAAKNAKSVAVTRGNMTYTDDPVGGALSYGTYKEYLQAYTAWAQGKYGKSGR